MVFAREECSPWLLKEKISSTAGTGRICPNSNQGVVSNSPFNRRNNGQEFSSANRLKNARNAPIADGLVGAGIHDSPRSSVQVKNKPFEKRTISKQLVSNPGPRKAMKALAQVWQVQKVALQQQCERRSRSQQMQHHAGRSIVDPRE